MLQVLNSGNGCIPEISYQGILVLRASDGTVRWSCEYLLFKESGYALLWHRELFLVFLRKAIQFSSVTQSCPALCDPMDCSMPGLPVHHQLLEFTQTHAHRVSDAIQPSHSLSSPSLKWVSSSHQVAKSIWSFSLNISPSSEHPGLISFRMDWLDLEGY